MPRRLRHLVFAYLILVGLAAHLLPVAGVYWATRHFGLTPSELLVKTVEKYGDRLPWVAAWFAPAPRFADHGLDGRVKSSHPRILAFTPGANGARSALARRVARYRSAGIDRPGGDVCRARQAYAAAVCWLVGGSQAAADKAVAGLAGAALIPRKPSQSPGIKGFGPTWRFAVTYDLMAAYPGLSEPARGRIEAVLRRTLELSLSRLDGGSLSLWHTRASLGAEAWIVAVALGTKTKTDRALAGRAQAHFLAAIEALRLSEAWPEGYNYWINSRAFIMALAASAYANGLDRAAKTGAVIDAVKAAAYWNLYALRPDHRIEGLGDEGPRVDQKDETRRFIDLVAQVSGDRVLAGYSRYLVDRHGDGSYYRAYRWAFPLLNDPAITPALGTADGDLRGLGAGLPHARLFGRGGLNLAFMRSGWAADATVIGFRAGAAMSHHGHYDAGHFTLFKGAPLAVNSSHYGGIFDENRLHYSIRSIAKNTLLLVRPGERVRPNRFFVDNVAAGGQRIVIPTGSAITGLADFEANRDRGKRYGGGRILSFSHRPGAHSFVSADLTRAYDTKDFDPRGEGGRATRVVRDLLYLHDDDVLIVRDDVETARSDIVKKWLLHTINRPDAADVRILKGGMNNGIQETADPVIAVRNGRGRLKVQRFAPRRARTRLIGGRDYRFYVETDGDDATLDGRNMAGGARDRPWFDPAMWRIEIRPATARKHHLFLIGLTPGLDRARPDALRRIETDMEGVDLLASRRSLIVSMPGGAGRVPDALPVVLSETQSRIYVLGAGAGTRIGLVAEDGRAVAGTVEPGIAMFEPAGTGSRKFTLRFTR